MYPIARLLALCCASVLILAGSARAQGKDFTAVFNGKDLAGWTGDPKLWRVENGTIIGEVPQSGIAKNEFLRFNRPLKNFELKLEVKMVKGNSGIQVHSRMASDSNFTSMRGPQVEISHHQSMTWSSLVTEPSGSPSILVPLNRVQSLVKPNDFNAMSIKCDGKHVTITLNGGTTVDGDFETMPAEGILALQLHKLHKGMRVEFRDLQMRELDATPVAKGPLNVSVQTVELPEGVKYAYRGGRPNRSNLVLAPANDGYRLGWTDLKGNAHVTPLTPDFKLVGNDLVLANLDLRGLVVHDDGAMGVMAAELPLKMCVLRLSPAGQEQFRTALTGARGVALKERYLDNLWCFSGQFAASPTGYAAHFAHVWQTDPNVAHQGGYYGQVDFQGKVVKENGWTVSHSLDQRVIHHKDAFLTLSLGDTFPNGVYFENRTTGKNLLSYPPPELKPTFDSRGTMHLGSLIPVGDNVAAAFVMQHGGTKILTYQLLSPDAKVLHSVKVTELPKASPHVVRLASYGGNLLLARQEGQEASKLVVIDHQGRILNQPTTVQEPLPDNDELVALPGGDVGWVLATHGERTVRFIRVKK